MARIAISYRRSDSQDITGRIFDRLSQQYGKETVFRDIDSIQPGIDFRTQIADALTAVDVLLVVVGPRWLGQGEAGRARINNEADPVRIEVETALKRSIPIIPVLVGGMKMPEVGDLPESLKDFAFRHAVTVDGGRDFDHHLRGLIGALDRFFAGKADALKPAATSATPTALVSATPRGSSSWRIYGLAGSAVVIALVVTVVILTNKTDQKAVPVQPSVTPAVQNIAVASSPAAPSVSAAERAWSVTKDSASVAVLNDFIRQFGDTPYGSMARARVQELIKSQTPAQPVVSTPVQPAPTPQVAAIAPTAASPSFACSGTLKPDEQAVCRNGELSYLDRQLDAVFYALLGKLNRDPQAQARLKEQENAWLKQRAACFGSEACIRDAYQYRLTRLRNWQ
ncbi:MAG TPA: TIR domain-containing protein [Xanthobacteraceae bacterium]|jgi:uncharacterized protein YecT (DUF1311 family)|nr:TIR domain-containing protein [Xanthobacteraceae bacterium]